jgi:hypothetical protein
LRFHIPSETSLNLTPECVGQWQKVLAVTDDLVVMSRQNLLFTVLLVERFMIGCKNRRAIRNAT